METVNKYNIKDIEFTALQDLLADVYTRNIENGADLIKLIQFYANQYAFMVGLWSVMLYEVKFMKKASQNKEAINDTITKRDYLEKVVSAVRVKYMTVNLLLKHKMSSMGGVTYE